MEQQLEIEDVMRRYLLGALPEKDQTEVEDRLLSNPEYLRQLMIAENELTDDYVQGSLSHWDRERVGRYLLAVPDGRQKLSFAKALSEYVSNAAPRKTLSRSVKKPSLYRRLRERIHAQAAKGTEDSRVPHEPAALASSSEVTWEYLLAEAKSNRDLLSSLSTTNWLGLRLLVQLRSDSLVDLTKLAGCVEAAEAVIGPVTSRLVQLGLVDEEDGLFFCTEVGVDMVEKVEEVFGISLKL